MLRDASALLFAEGEFALGAQRVPRVQLLRVVVACAFVHGAVMGSLGGSGIGALCSAVKLPVLMTLSVALCLPNFFVVNALLGLRADFPHAMRAILATQGTLALALVAQSPVVALYYVSRIRYSEALFLNGVVFAIATVAAQVMLARHYGPLIAKDRRHRRALVAWFALYVFVAIKLGWILRPFVGDPAVPTSFFRDQPWADNPYKNLFWTVAGVGGGLLKLLAGGN